MRVWRNHAQQRRSSPASTAAVVVPEGAESASLDALAPHPALEQTSLTCSASDSIAFYKHHCCASKLSRPLSLSTAHLFSVLALAALVIIQFFADQPPLATFFSVPSVSSSFELFATGTCPHKTIFEEELPVSRPHKMALIAEAKKIAAEFEYPAEEVRKGVKEFIREMDEGLQKNATTMSQIPTYVTAVPTGKEEGLYLAVDLGGTNFRVCSIHLNGNTTFSLTQSKVAIPHELMVAKTSKELFSFLAKQIEQFLKVHHNDHFLAALTRKDTNSTEKGYREEEMFQLGFTFSFPVHQVGINKGTLIRWTKGFDIHEAVGQDVCALLQTEIDLLGLPVKVAALVNDTVGTLMARSYTSPNKTDALLGAIFGTGTNGAYVEDLDKVTKMSLVAPEAEYDKTTGKMIINTEWGSFDNPLSVLPNTPYDEGLDKDSVNPGIQMFEKRVSGMFLGEILRRALLALRERRHVQLFRDDNSGMNDTKTTTNVAEDSPLFKQWGLDTSFMSIVRADTSPGHGIVKQTLERDLLIDAASAEDAEAVKIIGDAIGKRSARLSGVAIGSIVVATKRLETDETVDIGVDGSLVEYYPGFEEEIRSALRDIPEIGAEGEKRIRIGIAKDGSGVGAALIALVASKMAAAQKAAT